MPSEPTRQDTPPRGFALVSPIGNIVRIDPRSMGLVRIYLRHGWVPHGFSTVRLTSLFKQYGLSARDAAVAFERLTSVLRKYADRFTEESP